MRVGLYTVILLGACGVGAIIVWAGHGWLSRDAAHATRQAADLRALAGDTDRLIDAFEQWVVLCDLILGSDLPYLGDAEGRASELVSDQLRKLQESTAAAMIDADLALMVGFAEAQRGRMRRARAIGNEDREAQLWVLLDEVDRAIGRVQTAVENIRARIVEARAVAADTVDAAVARRLWYGVAMAIGYFAYMLLVWRWTSRTLSAPLRQLADAARTASASDAPARLAAHGPTEVVELAQAFSRLVSGLEARVSDRTRHLEVANRDLETARWAAEAANQAKSAFLANMSHEMRTPMHAVLSFAQIGSRKADSIERDKLRGFFDTIRNSADSLRAMLDDLLELAKLESGQATLSLGRVNLGDLVGATVSDFAPRAEREGQVVELVERCDVLAVVDADKIAQVLRQLLGNAVQYSEPGARTEVVMIGCDDSVAVGVLDRGIGIPEAELEHVFDKFTLSTSTDTGAGGKGIGLSIVRQVVTRHGGEAWAAARRGGGVEFWFELPVFESPEAFVAARGGGVVDSAAQQETATG